MIQTRSYDMGPEESRLTFHWETWGMWALVVAAYVGWTYLQLLRASQPPVDWTYVGLRTLVVALGALTVKEWMDLRLDYRYGH